MTEMRTPTRISVYWDTSDPESLGYSYRVSDNNGEIDSGAVEEIASVPDITTATDLQNVVVDIAYIHGIDITEDAISAADPVEEGGFATWEAE